MGNLQEYIETKLNELETILGTTDFVLFGSFPIDSLLNEKRVSDLNLHDVDVAIESLSLENMESVEKSLQEAGYDIIKKRREYPIENGTAMVVCTYASNGLQTIDVNFMEDVSKIGIYNAGSLYVDNLTREIVDLHNTLEGIKSKTLELTKPIDAEHPYLLVASLIKFSAKYEIPLTSSQNKFLVTELSKLSADIVNDGGSEKYLTSLISQTFKGILRSNDKNQFIFNLYSSGLLETYLPEVSKLIEMGDIGDIDEFNTVNDLIVYLADIMDPQERSSFENKTAPLQERVWEPKEYKRE